MSYITAKEVVEKWRVSRRHVQILYAEGRIKGAYKLGNTWATPCDVIKPKDLRNVAEINIKE